MAQSSLLTSATLTSLNVPTALTTGQGAPGRLRTVSGYVTTVSADDTGSRYRLVRFPTHACVKRVIINSKIASAGSGDIDVAYSNSTTDGTQQALATLTNPSVIIPSNDNKLFGAAVSLVGTGIDANYTYSGTYTFPMSNIPMWQNLVTLGTTQFTSDPGGFFDIYVVVTTAVTTGGVLGCEVQYIE